VEESSEELKRETASGSARANPQCRRSPKGTKKEMINFAFFAPQRDAYERGERRLLLLSRHSWLVFCSSRGFTLAPD